MLKNVLIDIMEFEIIVFIGLLGCGKLIFIRILNCMNDLISGIRVEGIIEYNGIDIYNKKLDVIGLRLKVGMVF